MAWLTGISILLSIAAALAIVPVVRWIARSVGLVDRPDAQRKLHREPVSLAGGVAVFASVWLTFAVTILIDRSDPVLDLGYVSRHWYVLFGCTLALLCVGLIDDAFSLRGRQKLLLQLLVISVLVGSGTSVERISLFGYELSLGMFAIPITIVWLLVAVNALNLIDGADGVATTAGCIISAGLAAVSFAQDAPLSGIAAFALAGSLAGFLVFNRPPATIFLGDAGSMTIGLMVGVLAIWSSVKEYTALASAPVAILAIPLFDSAAAIVRRRLTGRSIYATDRAHLHHLLQDKYGSLGMLWVVAALCITTTALSVFSVVLNLPLLAAIGVFLAVGLLLGTRSFGHSELRLVTGRIVHFARTFFTLNGNKEERHIRTVRLQGGGDWELVWEPLVDFARSHGISSLKIDLSLPWLHEGYHATWHSVGLPEKAFQLTIRFPLFVHRPGEESLVPIGRLELIAPAGNASVYQRVAEFTEKLADLAPQLDQIAVELDGRLTNKHATGKGAVVEPPGAGDSAPQPVEAASF